MVYELCKKNFPEFISGEDGKDKKNLKISFLKSTVIKSKIFIIKISLL